MRNRLTYKDFIGSVQYSGADEVFFGKIEGINDLVTFEGDSVRGLKLAFQEAVDDYLQLCKETGKEVFRSFKGSFNVRLDSQLHAQLFERASLQGVSLNQYVRMAIEEKLEKGYEGNRSRPPSQSQFES